MSVPKETKLYVEGAGCFVLDEPAVPPGRMHPSVFQAQSRQPCLGRVCSFKCSSHPGCSDQTASNMLGDVKGVRSVVGVDDEPGKMRCSGGVIHPNRPPTPRARPTARRGTRVHAPHTDGDALKDDVEWTNGVAGHPADGDDGLLVPLFHPPTRTSFVPAFPASQRWCTALHGQVADARASPCEV